MNRPNRRSNQFQVNFQYFHDGRAAPLVMVLSSAIYMTAAYTEQTFFYAQAHRNI